MPAPLLLSDDDALRADVRRVLDAVEVCSAGPSARAAWTAAPAVLVGADALEDVAGAGLPRRDQVFVLTAALLSQWQWKHAVDIGASAVMAIPGDERLLTDRLATPLVSLPGGRLVVVVGGSGGAGASTTAAALAQVAARSMPTLLVDADPYAGGLDVLVGVEDRPGLRWSDLRAADRVPDPERLAGSLPAIGDLCLLSHGFGRAVRPSTATVLAVRDAARQGFGLSVVDLSRTFDPAAEVWLAVADAAIVVVAATVRAVAAATTVTKSLSARGARIVVVVRDPGRSALSAPDVGTGLGLPVSGVIRSEPSIALAAEHGRPPLATGRRRAGSLDHACLELLAELAIAA